MTAVATLDPDSVIERIAAGEYQSHIAREAGIAPQTLHYQISKHPGYRDALKLRNMAKLDNSQESISNESSDLARAREEFKAAAWRAERECPDEWGSKAQVVNIQVNVAALDQSADDLLGKLRVVDAGQQVQRTIEQEPTDSSK